MASMLSCIILYNAVQVAGPDLQDPVEVNICPWPTHGDSWW